MLDWALASADVGWAVFPCFWPEGGRCSCRNPACDSQAKHPITEHGLSDASTDPDLIRRWWKANPTANIGCATGAISGIAAIDVDTPEAEDALYVAAGWTNGQPITRVHKTPRGGWHYLFQHPGTKVKNMPAVWINGKRVPGLDWRGDGGYILLPPSIGFTTKPPSGETAVYTVQQGGVPAPWPTTLLPIPERAVPNEALSASLSPRGNTGKVIARADRYAQTALERELELVLSAPEGFRNDQLNRSAHAIFRLPELSAGPVFDVFLEAALQVGLSEQEARATLLSAMKARAR